MASQGFMGKPRKDGWPSFAEYPEELWRKNLNGRRFDDNGMDLTDAIERERRLVRRTAYALRETERVAPLPPHKKGEREGRGPERII